MKTGDLVRLIERYKPTTLHLSEIKLSLGAMDSPWELQRVLFALGYKHCIFNWCTNPGPKGTPGHGNYGTAVLSKVWLKDVLYGLGPDDKDGEGRAITATTPNERMIWLYKPCSNWDPNDPRNAKRAAFDERLGRHYKREKATMGDKPVYVGGDLNIAPTAADCTPFAEGKWPSCTEGERVVHKQLMEDNNLVDTYAFFHPDIEEAAKGGRPCPEHFSWSGRSAEGEVGMRLDHFLIPEGLVSEPQGSSCIVGCSLTKSAHGSDHRAIYVDFDTGSEETSIPIEEWTAPRKEDGQAHRPRYSRARRCWSRKAQTEEMHRALDACPAEIAATSNPAEIFAILQVVERQTAEEGDSAELAAYKALRDTEVHFSSISG